MSSNTNKAIGIEIEVMFLRVLHLSSDSVHGAAEV
jgi:hypothetical protein